MPSKNHKRHPSSSSYYLAQGSSEWFHSLPLKMMSMPDVSSTLGAFPPEDNCAGDWDDAEEAAAASRPDPPALSPVLEPLISTGHVCKCLFANVDSMPVDRTGLGIFEPFFGAFGRNAPESPHLSCFFPFSLGLWNTAHVLQSSAAFFHAPFLPTYFLLAAECLSYS